MTTPAWTRPQWKPHLLRMVPITAIAASGVAFAAGLLAGGAATSTMTVPVVTPVQVTLPPPPPAPPPTVVVQAPPAPPAPEPPPPPPPPRAAAPYLTTMCLFARMASATDDAGDPSCAWDDGFPAISVDGKLIAIRGGGNAPSGAPGDGLALIDARTGRAVRSIMLLDPDEYTTEPEPLAKLQLAVAKRVAAAQGMLDERGFRPLRPLGTGHADSEPHGDAPHAEVYAEFANELIRVIDPATARELGRHSFAVPSPRKGPLRDDDFCGSWNFASISAWWDPVSRVVLAAPLYHLGGCMCGESVEYQTYRLPPPT